LFFDGDEAGWKGAMRFRKNMPKDVFITEVRLPAGKDVNDLTKEEIDYTLETLYHCVPTLRRYTRH
jgi:DNA primase